LGIKLNEADMLYKENWEETKKRFDALWENEVIDRCCIAIRAIKNGSSYNAEMYARPQKQNELISYYTDIDRVLERNLAEFQGTYYAGEALPVINPTWGDSGYALYCNSDYKYLGNTTWFTPTIKDWDTDEIGFNKNPEVIKKHIEFVKTIAKEAKGKFLMSTPDYIGNLDGLINLRGVEDTIIDLIDDPDRIKSGIKTMMNAVKTVGSEYFETINEACDGGSAFAWYDTWAKGRHNLVQCDFSAMISPQMFEEFVLPDLTETCDWLDYPVYHLDGQEQVRHLDMILSVKNLKMVQWTNVAGQPSKLNFIPVFKKIQEAGKGLLIFANVAETEILLSELSPKGLFINYNGDNMTEDEANAFIKRVASLTKNR
jgi:hypothetical protein